MRNLVIFSFLLSSFWLVACNSSLSEAPVDKATAEIEASGSEQARPNSTYIQNLGARKIFSLDGQWARIIDPYENGYYNYRDSC